MSNYLSEEQVYKLNEKHGWFQYGDAQSDVSKAFANDAIEAYERMRSAAPYLLALAQNFEIKGPDDDGLVWLILNGNGTSAHAMFNLGSADQLVVEVALNLEEDRRTAIIKAIGEE